MKIFWIILAFVTIAAGFAYNIIVMSKETINQQILGEISMTNALLLGLFFLVLGLLFNKSK